MGSGGFLVLYMAAGIFGFIQALSALRDHTEKNCRNVLGGNFALAVSPSVGASGAIFGTIAVSARFLVIASMLTHSRPHGLIFSPIGPL
jgi:membrane associated rhomboid family serine protease